MNYTIKNIFLVLLLALVISFPFYFKPDLKFKTLLISIIFVYFIAITSRKIGLILLASISLFFSLQQLTFFFTANGFIDSYYFVTILSTNRDEIKSFFNTITLSNSIVITSLFLIGITISCYTIKNITYSNITINKKYFIILMILNLLFINIIYKNLKNHIFPFHCIKSIFSAVGILFLNPLELKITKINKYEKPKANTIIIVIGESSSQSHYSLYDYKYNITNPLLSKRADLFKLNNVFSVGINTQPNVKTLLSGKIAKELDPLSSDLISVSKQLGFKTFYIDNNKFESYDPLVSLAKRANHYWNINGDAKTNNYSFLDSNLLFDEDMTSYLEKALKDQANNKLILLHMAGSHPAQFKRYPKKWNQLDHFYDNSILYTDYNLNTWINLLEQYSVNQNTAFLMISDHGVGFQADCEPSLKSIEKIKSFGANDNYLSSIKIPFFVWFSNQFQNQYPQEIKNIQSHENTPLDSRVLYDSVMELVGAKVVENKSVQQFSILNKQLQFLPRMNYKNTNIDESIKAGKVCLTPGFDITQ